MSHIKQSSVAKFKSKEALIGVAGLGYVGLALMSGCNTIAFRNVWR